MRLSYLGLSFFRNFQSLELRPPLGLVVLYGDNAQGKSNLLEAIILLATTRSPRADAERELINWKAFAEPLPVARVVADVERGLVPVRVEVALRALDSRTAPGREDAVAVEKRFKVDGLPQTASQVVGQARAVLFSTHDVELVGGAPSLRRRFLDIALCQLDRDYMRHLQRYQRVLAQRNHLLRRISQGLARAEELAFWDAELVTHGSAITLGRARFLAELQQHARPIHDTLSRGQNGLGMAYVPGVPGLAADSAEDAGQPFRLALKGAFPREIETGSSQVGPHRDDVHFALGNVDAGVYGSRGQRRTIALALRLAEVRLQASRTGEHPLVLLDDVFAELDAHRRRQVMEAIVGYQQAIVTTTDLNLVSPDLLAGAGVFRMEAGKVMPVTPGYGGTT
ncbi:MAG: DNA replication/repair protein RecF [Chloroflexi bacterium]|nr:DNA replication/repair protein RecF [Chloroflexota bacterium]